MRARYFYCLFCYCLFCRSLDVTSHMERRYHQNSLVSSFEALKTSETEKEALKWKLRQNWKEKRSAPMEAMLPALLPSKIAGSVRRRSKRSGCFCSLTSRGDKSSRASLKRAVRVYRQPSSFLPLLLLLSPFFQRSHASLMSKQKKRSRQMRGGKRNSR